MRLRWVGGSLTSPFRLVLHPILFLPVAGGNGCLRVSLKTVGMSWSPAIRNIGGGKEEWRGDDDGRGFVMRRGTLNSSVGTIVYCYTRIERKEDAVCGPTFEGQGNGVVGSSPEELICLRSDSEREEEEEEEAMRMCELSSVG